MEQMLNKRIEKIISEKRLKKAEVSEKLGISYTALWRKLSGERSISVDFLLKLASVLGTTASYLLEGTDNSKNSFSSVTDTLNKEENNSREVISKPGHLVFKQGDISIDIPDTPVNKTWFNNFVADAVMKKAAS